MKTCKIKVIRCLLPVMIFGLLMASCSGGEETSPSITTPATPTPPAIPSNVKATATSSTSITVSWSSVSYADNYDVYYETGSTPMSRLTTVTGTSYTHTGLQPNTAYNYYVTATNSAGTSDYSSRASAMTPIDDAAGRRPSAPTGVTATLLPSGNIRISWNLVDLATSYDVFYQHGDYSITGVGYFPGVMTFVANVTNPPYTLTSYEARDSVYLHIYVKAKNSAGESDFSPFYATVDLRGF